MKHILQKYIGTRKTTDKELFNELMAKRFTVKDLTELDSKINYRTINYWDEKGYLLSQTDEEGWRKFCFAEYVWILLLDELREFDIAVKNIIPSLFIDFGIAPDVLDEMNDSERQRLQKMDFKKLLGEIDRDFALENFCRMLTIIIFYKTPLTLRFFKNGSSFPIYGNPAYHGIKIMPFLNEYNEVLIKSNFKSSVSISIDSLIKDFIDNKDLDNISQSMVLAQDEVKVLKHIQDRELQEVTIFYKDGKPHKIELTDKVKIADVTKRVKEHFFSQYERCEFIANGEKSHFIRRTTVKKIND